MEYTHTRTRERIEEKEDFIYNSNE